MATLENTINQLAKQEILDMQKQFDRAMPYFEKLIELKKEERSWKYQYQYETEVGATKIPTFEDWRKEITDRYPHIDLNMYQSIYEGKRTRQVNIAGMQEQFEYSRDSIGAYFKNVMGLKQPDEVLAKVQEAWDKIFKVDPTVPTTAIQSNLKKLLGDVGESVKTTKSARDYINLLEDAGIIDIGELSYAKFMTGPFGKEQYNDVNTAWKAWQAHYGIGDDGTITKTDDETTTGKDQQPPGRVTWDYDSVVPKINGIRAKVDDEYHLSILKTQGIISSFIKGNATKILAAKDPMDSIEEIFQGLEETGWKQKFHEQKNQVLSTIGEMAGSGQFMSDLEFFKIVVGDQESFAKLLEQESTESKEAFSEIYNTIHGIKDKEKDISDSSSFKKTDEHHWISKVNRFFEDMWQGVVGKDSENAPTTLNKNFIKGTETEQTEELNVIPNAVKVRVGKNFQHMPKYVDLIEKHFPEKERSTALAVLTAESSGDSNSHRKNKWENSYGLFQINYKIWEKTLKEAGIIKDAKDLLDPETNIKAAAHILSVSNRGWGEWTGTFGKNLHKQFIPEK